MKRRTDASVQLLVLSFVCFCCPGLFNALTSFASGLSDPAVAYRGNVIVYLSFATCSLLVAARITNVRVALMLGSVGYVCYAAAVYNLEARVLNSPLEIYYAACAALGISAGFLWTTQGRMVMSYATSENQGSYLSIFWIIFNLGAASGGFVSFGLNFSSTRGMPAGHASGLMYAVFVGMMSAGVLVVAFGIVDSRQVVREDGTTPADTFEASESSDTWWAQLKQQLEATTTKQVRAMLCLLPLFAYSNWFYTYHSFFNVSVFNVRTSGLSSSFYWLAQMAAAYLVGRALDAQVRKRVKLSTLVQSCSSQLGRVESSTVGDVGVRSLALFTLLANFTWAVGWYLQSELNLQYGSSRNLDVAADFTAFLPPFLLYTLYGWNDALCQVWVYWYMGSLADRNATVCGCFAGIYKGVQAISAAIAWHIGAIKTDPQDQLLINWLLCNVAMLGAYISVVSFCAVEDDMEVQPLLRPEAAPPIKSSQQF